MFPRKFATGVTPECLLLTKRLAGVPAIPEVGGSMIFGIRVGFGVIPLLIPVSRKLLDVSVAESIRVAEPDEAQGHALVADGAEREHSDIACCFDLPRAGQVGILATLQKSR